MQTDRQICRERLITNDISTNIKLYFEELKFFHDNNMNRSDLMGYEDWLFIGIKHNKAVMKK